MTIVSGGVRSQVWHGAVAGRPSVREVCLLGIKTARAGSVLPGASPPDADIGRAWTSGGRVTWSGRAYRVEATQVHPAGAGADESLRYVHLSAVSPG